MTIHTDRFVPAYVVPMLRDKAYTKIPLFASYMAGIASPVYNLAHVIAAYGPEFTHWLIEEIVAGRLDTRQVTARWLADRMLRHESFDPARYQGEPEDYLSDLGPAQSNPIDQVYAAAC